MAGRGTCTSALLARVEATLAHGAHPEPHYRR